MKCKKGQIWISVIIYTLVALLALLLILNTGIPILTEMKDRSTLSKVRDVMIEIDKHITEVANQGEGSQAAMALEIREGEVRLVNNEFIWEIETKSKLMSPRTSTTLGNILISSNANVRTYETDDAYLMNNTIKNNSLTVKINKKGSETNWVYYDTSQLIQYVYFKENTMGPSFKFNLNNNDTSGQGYGYTKMIPAGNNSNLGRAKVIAHMNSSFGEYDIEFTLESYADFLIVKIKNFRPK